MDFAKPGPLLAPCQLRALTMVARAASNGLDPPQRALLDALQQLHFETGLDVETLKEIPPEELAARSDDPTQARQLIRLMVVMSLAAGPPSLEQMSLLRAFSAALGVDEPAVKVIGHLARGKMLRFRLAFFRRSHLRHYFRNTYRDAGGVLAFVRWLLIFRGVLGEDARITAPYRALKDLPEDSLGHRFFEHCAREGLPLPGEHGGFPSGAIYHDFAHVLAGYDTSPEGEMKAAAFQAGFTKGDHEFFTWLFSIFLHTTGINLSPFEIPVVRGRIGQGTLAKDIVCALQRGTALKADLGEGWDCWKYVELPVEVARKRLGVPPLDSRVSA